MADLTSLQSSDSIKIAGADSSGSETNFVNSTNKGELTVADGLNSGGLVGNLSLPTANTPYEVKVGASRLSGRKSVMIIALDGEIFWGYSNSVTTISGFPLAKGQSITFSINANDNNFQVWVVSANANKNARVAETP